MGFLTQVKGSVASLNETLPLIESDRAGIAGIDSQPERFTAALSTDESRLFQQSCPDALPLLFPRCIQTP
jgi:hypothetical protein